MRILLFGAGGQVGSKVKQVLGEFGDVKSCDRSVVDLTDQVATRAIVQNFMPDFIINAAAYTAVDKAESEQQLAMTVNADAVSILANEAKQVGALLIHYSTDYVFDGAKVGAYKEADKPNPINVYGMSKLAGEQAILASGCDHYIFRTTWVIGCDGNNFAKTILRLAKDRQSLNVINDQQGVPTSASLIANVTKSAIQSRPSNAWPNGIYNLTPSGQTTWYGVAKFVVALARSHKYSLASDDIEILPIPTSDYPTAANRPLNSQLDCTKLQQVLAFELPNWKDDFSIVANEILEDLK